VNAAKSRLVDMALEVVVMAVADVDRAKRFYGDLGWRLDADIAEGENFRLVQFTLPGSACSVHFRRGVTPATSGSQGCLYLVVSDINAARKQLEYCGVDVSEIFHRSPGNEMVAGQDPRRASYASFVSFNDADGNTWLVQEVTARLPGRSETGVTTFKSTAELASTLRRAAVAHGEHEKKSGRQDISWPDWHAQYIVSEQAKAPF
jgi:catechol 2,3-dioxygenase-like lactoylglutathione lyase family enzyme